MEDRARPEDYRLLGISPEAGAAELERAYHRVKVLYGEGSLASYSMMDDQERAAMRGRVEDAYLRASRTLSLRQEAGFTPPAASLSREEAGFTPPAPGEEAAAVAAPPPSADPSPAPSPAPAEPFVLDWTAPPGPQMKRNREARGVTLRQIATVTRIRSTHFANAEEGRLSELPAPVYLRGFLIEYARRTALADPEAFAARYLAWVAQQPQYKG